MKWVQDKKEKFDLSLRLDGVSRDLLQNHYSNGVKLESVEEEDEIELSLGLSMNGRFGVDPISKKLKRSSSISTLVLTPETGTAYQARGTEPAVENHAPLLRTRSLPTAAEEEWRRRKEWQTMRRLEARKKRMKKLKNLRVVKDNNTVESGVMIPCDGSSETPDDPFGGSKQESFNEESNKLFPEMPFVSTKGEGSNKVEGFLYRYKKGEEVRILCVCHGLFLSPAEFVKHRGGADVEHPLKHIVVNPFPLL